MKKTITRKIAFLLAMITLFASILTLSSSANSQKGVMMEQGGVADADLKTEAEQFVEFLLDPSQTIEGRQATLRMAAYAGLDPSDLVGVTLSSEDLAVFDDGLALQPDAALRAGKSILQAPPFAGSEVEDEGPTRAVTFPNYALFPVIRKQIQSNWCSAGTIETVLKYIKGDSGFTVIQYDIMYGSGGVGGGPGFQTVVDYTNKYLASGSKYTLYVFGSGTGGSGTNKQNNFDTKLLFDVLNYKPAMFTLSNSTGSSNWPFPNTAGHFCTVEGKMSWKDNKYLVGDPYFFKKGLSSDGTTVVTYCSNATDDNGYHERTWAQMLFVSTEKHGNNNEKMAW